jgi:choline dehydrogenase-like flavoprotein
MNAPARVRKRYDYLIVGAGFAGSILAERLASQHGASVLLIDRRPHIGGNAYDEKNEGGILYHKYGPHIFHTNSDAVVDYLSQFTEWRPYEHRVLAKARGQLVPIPINRTTLNMLFDAKLETDDDAAAFLAARAEPVEAVLPWLYAQAMGSRSERTRQAGHLAHPDAHQHRRPLFHRQLPGDAARRLHRDVQADARQPADRDPHRRRFSRCPRRSRCRTHYLYRPDR